MAQPGIEQISMVRGGAELLSTFLQRPRGPLNFIFATGTIKRLLRVHSKRCRENVLYRMRQLDFPPDDWRELLEDLKELYAGQQEVLDQVKQSSFARILLRNEIQELMQASEELDDLIETIALGLDDEYRNFLIREIEEISSA